jgi:hypothetical protein
MLQRIQSLYMALSAIATGALPFVFELWTLKTDNQATAVFITTSALYLSLFGLGEGYWDVSSCNFYRFISLGKQGNKKGRRSRKICGSITINLSS